jgi:hypothetical protein
MPKRTDEQILEDLRDIEAQLSPENLHWDGERPAADARRAERELKAKRAKLIKELGREPSFKEVYGE